MKKKWMKWDMSEEDAKAKCFSLRCQARRGSGLSTDDSKFVRAMFEAFPEWYAETERDVFNQTIPFGSNAYLDENNQLKYGTRLGNGTE